MPQVHKCSFCGTAIAPGTGRNFVRRDGRVLRFCGSKCLTSAVVLRRDPRKFKWTEAWSTKQRR
ncbi:50S ribosomal protein L24 [Candidatus Bathyarchaeota archaeon]|nr:50S ribosomal protein L24 [Candidatus Bathyarchaeota archaeon]